MEVRLRQTMCAHMDSFAGYCDGCSGVAGGVGVVAGGVVVGASVGGDAGIRYHTMISATTTAAAIMSTLFMSIATPNIARTRLPRLWGSEQVRREPYQAMLR